MLRERGHLYDRILDELPDLANRQFDVGRIHFPTNIDGETYQVHVQAGIYWKAQAALEDKIRASRAAG